MIHYRPWHSDEHEARAMEMLAAEHAARPGSARWCWHRAYEHWRDAVLRAMFDPTAPMDELIQRAAIAADRAGRWDAPTATLRLRRIVAGEEPDPC